MRPLDAIADARNMAGMAGAAVGVGLELAGFVGAGWLLIVGGGYAIGFLGAQVLAPQRTRAGTASASEPISDMTADLRRLADRVGPGLPTTARTSLGAILEDAASIEERVSAMDQSSIDLLPLRQFLGDYLPNTLRNYEKVPRALRGPDERSGRAPAQGTPAAQISAQLDLLARQMRTIVATLAKGDMDAIEAQGRFLSERFATARSFTDI